MDGENQVLPNALLITTNTHNFKPINRATRAIIKSASKFRNYAISKAHNYTKQWVKG